MRNPTLRLSHDSLVPTVAGLIEPPARWLLDDDRSAVRRSEAGARGEGDVVGLAWPLRGFSYYYTLSNRHTENSCCGVFSFPMSRQLKLMQDLVLNTDQPFFV